MKLSGAAILSGVGLVGAGLLALVGAVLPWAEAPFGISKSGVEGDGALTLVAGLAVAAIAVVRLLRPGSRIWKWVSVVGGLLLCGFVLLVALVDIADVGRIVGESGGLVRIGSGLYVTALAGGVGMAGAALGAFGGAKAETEGRVGLQPSGEPTLRPRSEPPPSPSTGLTMPSSARLDPAEVQSHSIPEEIRRLAKLRDEGLITPEEFEEKRRYLVDQL